MRSTGQRYLALTAYCMHAHAPEMMKFFFPLHQPARNMSPCRRPATAADRFVRIWGVTRHCFVYSKIAPWQYILFYILTGFTDPAALVLSLQLIVMLMPTLKQPHPPPKP